MDYEEKASELGETVREGLNCAARESHRIIHDHPYSSLGVAMGVGVILGAFIFRR